MAKRALEIMLDRDAQALFDSFSSCFGIRIVFYSPEGRILAAGDSRTTDSDFCSLIQKRLYGEKRCLELDAANRAAAMGSRTTISYRCHAGLGEAIVPAFAGDSLLGFVMIGQFRSEEILPAAVRAEWRRRAGSTELERAFAELPLVPAEKTKDLLKLLSVLVEHIVARRLIALKGSALLDTILTYIRDNPERPIRLAEAAALVHRSESTVSHLFRQRLGLSFREALIEEKLGLAEECMRLSPGITVREAASRVGYDDPFHFSSLYKKRRGIPPSEYLGRYRRREDSRA